MKHKIVYVEHVQNRAGQWFSRTVAQNGRELTRTSETYRRRGDSVNAIFAIRTTFFVEREPRPVKRRKPPKRG